jgi:hypothetical protein
VRKLVGKGGFLWSPRQGGEAITSHKEHVGAEGVVWAERQGRGGGRKNGVDRLIACAQQCFEFVVALGGWEDVEVMLLESE